MTFLANLSLNSPLDPSTKATGTSNVKAMSVQATLLTEHMMKFSIS